MTSEAHSAAVKSELLRVALHNSARSIPLQLLAVGVVAMLGVHTGARVPGAFALVLGVCVAVWRLRLSKRFPSDGRYSQQDVASATRALEANSILAGALWAFCSFAIYPLLADDAATTYVVIAIGSVATAALFMSLVGTSFYWLVALTLGSVVVASLAFDHVRSIPLAALIGLFALTMLRAAREVSETTSRAISHGLEKDAATESLLQAKEAAESANVAKSQFLATMSHEIRTPMNGVLGSLDLLRHSELGSHQRHLVNTAAASGASLMEILNDVLDHSKIEAGKLSLACAPMSLVAICDSVASLFKANALRKGVQLDVQIDPELPEWVLGDAQRLKQVLLNLVGNAVKFTERGHVRLMAMATGSVAGEVSVRFEVSDTGIGIPAEFRSRLFQPFHQAATAGTRKVGGTGLGLAISQRIVQAMGSSFEVTSDVGVGSRFAFTLLLARDDSPSHEAQIDSALGGLGFDQRFDGCVLLVEDNEVNRMIARETLVSLGLEVVEACDGLEALQEFESRAFDLVLMDCLMPVLDGYKAAAEMRRRESAAGASRTPIVALTANAGEDVAEGVLSVGMDAHLAKPYSRAQMRDVIRRWLAVEPQTI